MRFFKKKKDKADVQVGTFSLDEYWDLDEKEQREMIRDLLRGFAPEQPD